MASSYKALRAAAWNHEFGMADEETQYRLHGRERARRQAALRKSGSHASSATAACTGSTHRDVSLPLVHVPDLSRHGHRRLRQRGIALEQALTVIDYGHEQRSHGASRYFLDRRSRERLAVEMPLALKGLHTLDIQVVLADDGTLVTAAHRTRRIRRDIQHNRRRFND